MAELYTATGVLVLQCTTWLNSLLVDEPVKSQRKTVALFQTTLQSWLDTKWHLISCLSPVRADRYSFMLAGNFIFHSVTH